MLTASSDPLIRIHLHMVRWKTKIMNLLLYIFRKILLGVTWSNIYKTHVVYMCIYIYIYINIDNHWRQSNPITGLNRPWEFQEAEAPRFQDSRHMKVVRLSALRTGRLYLPRKCSWYSFLLDAESTPGPRCGVKDCHTIRKWTRDLPTRSAVPQPTAPPRTP